MRRSLGILVLTTLLLATSAGFAGAQAHFTARLDGPQETPPLAIAARGTAAATLTSLGLHLFVTVEGLSGPIIDAHIHDGASGVSGPPVRSILAEFGGT